MNVPVEGVSLSHDVCSDEPDGDLSMGLNYPPSWLQELYVAIKLADPDHLVGMAFNTVWDDAPTNCNAPWCLYRNATDVLFPDMYPITAKNPGGNACSFDESTCNISAIVGKSIELAVRQTRDDQAVWFVEQEFGGLESHVRMPSRAEERTMAYIALAHGATGVMFVSLGFRPSPRGPCLSPRVCPPVRTRGIRARLHLRRR